MIAATVAGLGASFLWALAPLLAQKPARLLGAFEFTRIQLISSFALLTIVVTLTVGWSSVSARHAPAYVLSSIVGVIFCNLALVACLRRGGAQRMETLFALNAPIAATLGYLFLEETLSPIQMVGIGLGMTGVMLAVARGQNSSPGDALAGALPKDLLIKVILFGLIAATSNAIGLLALQPVLADGTEPLAVTAMRTGGAALMIIFIALWPAKAFEPLTARTPALTLAAIVPGIMGYVIAVCLQLYALKAFGSGIAALLGSASPIMILPISWLLYQEKPPINAWIGATLAVVGAGMTVTG